MKANVLFVAPTPAVEEMAREMAPAGVELTVCAGASAAYHAALPEAEYLIGYVDLVVRDELYATAPNLKLIQMLSAGYDRADLDAARRGGVPLCNNGGANAVAVSEHALMLMLAVSRRLVRQHENVTSGRWRGNDFGALHELAGRTLGLIGLGSIGKKTAHLARAFGMQVVYADTQRLSEAEEDAIGVRFRLLREILRDCDIISLHVPLNASTEKLIGAAELALMKPSAIIINTSRGPVIDEAALADALASVAIAGAGLDVLEQEPPAPDNALFALDNVVLTAHLAGPTWESNTARFRNAYDNVERVARGDAPLWVIPELKA